MAVRLEQIVAHARRVDRRRRASSCGPNGASAGPKGSTSATGRTGEPRPTGRSSSRSTACNSPSIWPRARRRDCTSISGRTAWRRRAISAAAASWTCSATPAASASPRPLGAAPRNARRRFQRQGHRPGRGQRPAERRRRTCGSRSATASRPCNRCSPAGERFDAVVLDPPKFARSRRALDDALRAYHWLNRLAVELLEPGGILVTCSCSGHVTREDFRMMLLGVAQQTRRDIQILQEPGPRPTIPSPSPAWKANT